jgi:hypothetical protein
MEKSPISKLKDIENVMFAAGNKCVAVFNSKGTIVPLRMAVSAYRTSMQAMRDGAKRTATIKRKPRTSKGT